MDSEEILAKQVEQLEKEKREQQEKLRGQEKKARKTSLQFRTVKLLKCNVLIQCMLCV